MADINDSSCAVCGVGGELKRCARCKVVRYCSKAHQVQDWRKHKPFCRKPSGDSDADDKDKGGRGAAAEPVSGAQGPSGDDHNDDAIPFDDRPLKLLPFETPKSNSIENQMELCVSCMKKDGFCILDGILTDAECTKLLDEIKHLEQSGRMKTGKLAGGQTGGNIDDMVVNQSIRSDNMVWLEATVAKEPDYPTICNLVSNKMDAFILPLTAYFDGEVIISGRTKAMVACYPGGGTNYHRHVDNPSKDGRIITAIFYTNKDWDSETNDGVLRLFPTSRPGEYVDVAPVLNRLLIFWSDRRNPHEVRPAYAARYAITVWYFNADERAKAKEAKIAAEIKKAEDDLQKVQLKAKQVEKEILEKKVKATTTTALNMLSEAELEALTEMVSVHPDPRALLTQMGVAQVLQEGLLKTIAERRKR